LVDDSVPSAPQISSNRCQSALLRARRDTFNPITSPTRPKLTSATQALESAPVHSGSAAMPENPHRSQRFCLSVPAQFLCVVLEVVLQGRALTVLFT